MYWFIFPVSLTVWEKQELFYLLCLHRDDDAFQFRLNLVSLLNLKKPLHVYFKPLSKYPDASQKP